MKSFKNEGQMWYAICEELDKMDEEFTIWQVEERTSKCDEIFDRYRKNYPEYAWILADDVEGFFCDKDGNITKVVYVR